MNFWDKNTEIKFKVKMKKYNVQVYYSTFCSYEIEANEEQEALLKARKIGFFGKEKELIMNLENWEEADLVEELK